MIEDILRELKIDEFEHDEFDLEIRKTEKVIIFNKEANYSGYLQRIQYHTMIWLLCSRKNAEVGDLVSFQHDGMIKATGRIVGYLEFEIKQRILDKLIQHKDDVYFNSRDFCSNKLDDTILFGFLKSKGMKISESKLKDLVELSNERESVDKIIRYLEYSGFTFQDLKDKIFGRKPCSQKCIMWVDSLSYCSRGGVRAFGQSSHTKLKINSTPNSLLLDPKSPPL